MDAIGQQLQIDQLLRALQAKSEELQALKGDPMELQQTLTLVEALKEQHRQALENAAAAAYAVGNWTRLTVFVDSLLPA